MDHGQERFQFEIGRAIASLQEAQRGLSEARATATIQDEQTFKGFALAISNTRAALVVACVLSLSDTRQELNELYGDVFQYVPSGAGTQ